MAGVFTFPCSWHSILTFSPACHSLLGNHRRQGLLANHSLLCCYFALNMGVWLVRMWRGFLTFRWNLWGCLTFICSSFLSKYGNVYSTNLSYIREDVTWLWLNLTTKEISSYFFCFSQNRLEYEKRVRAQARAMAPQE